MKDIQIIRGQEFKVQVRDTIDESDIFVDEYRYAAHLLEEILYASNQEMNAVVDKTAFTSNNHTEYNNNIIAFCGERGDGKSSAMLTFIHAIENLNKADKCNLFHESSIVKKTRFVDKIHVDPSALDGVHSVLDLVVTNMFRHFKKECEKENRQVNVHQRDELIRCFQKVYSALSLKKDSKSILNEEFDDEGSIAKLSKLSESMRLKEYMSKLIGAYFEYMKSSSEENVMHNNAIIISIDDLDLNVSAAYMMSEDIRKYLIIPGIVILMAIRIKQLHLAIEENNIHHFQHQFNVMNSNQKKNEIQIMAEKYVTKLIPLAHRVNLPKVQDITNTRIVYKGNYPWEIDSKSNLSKSNSIVEIVLEKIYEKTGMIIRPFTQTRSLILPDNIRGMISFIILLDDLEKPVGDEQEKNKIKYKNIMRILNSYCRELLDNLPEKNKKEEFIHQELIKLVDFSVDMHLHAGISTVLDKIYDMNEEQNVSSTHRFSDQFSNDTNYGIDSLCCVMSMIRRIKKDTYNIEIKRYLSAISFLYTIKLNLLMNQNNDAERADYELDNFTKYIIWGYDFLNVIPYVNYPNFPRGRFVLRPAVTYNCIIKQLEMPTYSLKEFDVIHIPNTVPKESGERKKYILSWILFGMFCNSFDTISNPQRLKMLPWVQFIYGNFILNSAEQVSIENFIVRICMLDTLYEQLNLEMLGITNEEFQNIVQVVKEKNKLLIEISKHIVTNVDVIQEIVDYCLNHNEYKRGTKDEFDRSKKLMEKFLKNLLSYFKGINYMIQLPDNADNLESIQYFRFGDGENDIVDITELYADFIQKSTVVRDTVKSNNVVVDKNQMVELLDALEMRNNEQRNYIYFASFIRPDAKLQKMKTYLLNMSKNIGKYMLLSGDRGYLSEEWKKQICDLYEKVLGELQKNENGTVTDSLREQYRALAQHFKPMYLEDNIKSLLKKKDM